MISDAETQDDLGEQLFEAIEFGEAIDIEWLTDLFEEGVYVNVVDDLGWTPLMRAGTFL